MRGRVKTEVHAHAQSRAFIENTRHTGNRSLTVAALIGVAASSIRAATVRERLHDGLRDLCH